jgi:hypothetical protein
MVSLKLFSKVIAPNFSGIDLCSVQNIEQIIFNQGPEHHQLSGKKKCYHLLRDETSSK